MAVNDIPGHLFNLQKNLKFKKLALKWHSKIVDTVRDHESEVLR